VAYQGKLKIAGAAFGPRSSENSDRTLGGVSQSHLCVNDEVVDVAIGIEIHGQNVCVPVTLAKGAALSVAPGQFGAFHPAAIAPTPNDGSVKQLRLGKRARAGGQRGSIAAGGGERQ
jgi:hypothetical protein